MKATLDWMIIGLKASPHGVFIEIEGLTDDVGGRAHNERLGLARRDGETASLRAAADAWRKIKVISYGQ